MPLNEVNDVPLVVPTSSKFSMTKFHIFESEVFELLSGIDCSRASAPGLSARIVREAAPVITPITTCLFNQSLEQEQFAENWKLGYITSVIKSGDPHEVNNYRPITLLPVLGLLVKLKAKGLPPSLVNWFESYLSNREIVTMADDIPSAARIVDRGVPRGAVLGPLMFLIFIDDLGDNVSATMRLFADDASLYRVTEKNDIRKGIDQANEDLLLIYEWSITWKLYLNIDQGKAIFFSTRERDTLASLSPVLINKSPISYVVEQKQLGLILRSNLDWTAHVDYVLTKAVRCHDFWPDEAIRSDRARSTLPLLARFPHFSLAKH
ncbi:unnamed protein product [Didymodactylos carnosus]|uniref:Reverse transcriptase domain-containing protein n=1 Tax=Didymodactylos carnosus TaxID=1234261 RepID=A0A814TQV9_9BILA|nr:unnamed protein product [Didymodactylos carnosus]CAF3928252.1 unnamed protein product [Didymodactylos carnosus]